MAMRIRGNPFGTKGYPLTAKNRAFAKELNTAQKADEAAQRKRFGGMTEEEHWENDERIREAHGIPNPWKEQKLAREQARRKLLAEAEAIAMAGLNQPRTVQEELTAAFEHINKHIDLALKSPSKFRAAVPKELKLKIKKFYDDFHWYLATNPGSEPLIKHEVLTAFRSRRDDETLTAHNRADHIGKFMNQHNLLPAIDRFMKSENQRRKTETLDRAHKILAAKANSNDEKLQKIADKRSRTKDGLINEAIEALIAKDEAESRKPIERPYGLPRRGEPLWHQGKYAVSKR